MADDPRRDPFRELRDVGSPRPLPPSLRARLEDTLLTSAHAVLPEGLDAARPLRPSFRRRLEEALSGRSAARWRVGVGVAAVLVIVLGFASLVVVPRGDGPARVASGARDSNAEATADNPVALQAPAPLSDAPGGTDQSGSPVAGGSAAATAAGPGGAGAKLSTRRSAGPPPPYAYATDAPAERSAAASGEAAPQGSSGESTGDEKSPPPSSAGDAPARSALSVAVVGGDAGQEAGFRAYVDLLNRNGGVGGHPLKIVAGRPTGPTAGSLLTVNLSGATLPGTWGPRLESLSAGEDVLRGDVFGFAGAPERQAHLIADEVFPTESNGATAVVYTGSGPLFGTRIPDAIESALRTRGVAVLRVPYTGGRLAPTRAEAAFLSLDTELARTWFADAARVGVSPPRGVAGVFSLLSESLAGSMPEGTRVMAPYRYPTGEEAAALRRAANRGMDSSLVHGWATAKSLAVALWQSGATTSAQVPGALRALTGYRSGMAPAYEVRPGTNSRTPEAILHSKQQVLAPRGGFRRDPH